MTASQAGDDNYNAAPSVPRMFMINRAIQSMVNATAPSDATHNRGRSKRNGR